MGVKSFGVRITALVMTSAAPRLASSLATPPLEGSTSFAVRRTFQFVPYPQPAPALAADDPRPTLSCDGKISGATHDLTHWNGNDTPDDLYADTSTGMALRLAEASSQHGRYRDWTEAVVLNNHYDTDGVLSVFACLDPAEALRYHELLLHGAEAGDFGEWNSDAGVKLNCALVSLDFGDDAASFDRALELLPDLLHDLSQDGTRYEPLWKAGFEEALNGWEDVVEGRVSVSKGPGNIAIVLEKPDSTLSPYALHRALTEGNIWKDTHRVLRVHREKDGKNSFRYEYDRIGHGWVHKLVDRPMVPNVDGSELARQMGPEWTSGGRDMFLSICSSQATSQSPEEASTQLWKYDDGCS